MFSVIIPTYNRLDLLKRAINSVLNQTFQEFEIIVVDDCSSDGTWNWMKSIKKSNIKVYQNNINSGESVSRNYGVSISKYDFVCFLDDDDEWLENHLYEFDKLLKLDPSINLAFSSYIKRYQKKKEKAIFSNVDNDFYGVLPNFFSNCYSDVIMIPSGSVVQKEIFEKFGGYNTKIRYGEDIELFTKLGINGIVGFTNQTTMVYNLNHLTSQTNNTDKYLDGKFVDFSQFKNFEEQNPSLKKWIDLNRFSIARQLKINGDKKYYHTLIKKIDKNNISCIKRFSFSLPKSLLAIINKVYFQINRL